MVTKASLGYAVKVKMTRTETNIVVIYNCVSLVVYYVELYILYNASCAYLLTIFAVYIRLHL